jgi:uncharacterized protein (DUF58 family)
MASVLKFLNWKNFLRIARADNAPVVLSRRHIYILPTRFGLLYAVVLIAMLIGSINYTLSLGFILTFLLAGMGSMAMLHTWRNLAHLSIEGRHVEPVFAGEDAIFEIVINESKNRSRYAIAAHFDDIAPVYTDIPASGQAMLKLKFPARKRGWLNAPRISFFTEFPLSLFHVWAYAHIDIRGLVYPHPVLNSHPVPPSSDHGAAGGLDAISGDDDFAGHRAYQLGDSPRRVDWKASSREQGLLTKQFLGEAQSSLWLDWSLTPGADTEQRLSQLTRWIVDAHTDRQSYGLRLPRLEIKPNTGEAHYHQCLRALALLDA